MKERSTNKIDCEKDCFAQMTTIESLNDATFLLSNKFFNKVRQEMFSEQY